VSTVATQTKKAATASNGGAPRPETAERYLVVNADDFGRTPGINRGVVRAHERGIVTSASLTVRWPAAAEAAAYARRRRALGVGLHVDIGEWVYEDGEWQRSYEVVATDDAAAVAAEVERQLAEFRRLVGRDPTHLDSHQSAHRQVPLDRILLDLARRLRVPLRHYAPDVRFCGAFYGQTSRGDAYRKGVTVEALLHLLGTLEPGMTELRCHPGEDERWEGPYREERPLELATLCTATVRDHVVCSGIELRSFGDLRDRLDFDTAAWSRHCRKHGIEAYNGGDFRESRTWFTRALDLHGSSKWALLWLARSELKLGNLDASHAAVSAALDYAPGWAPAGLHLVDLLSRQGRRDESIALLEELRVTHRHEADVVRRVTNRLLHLKEYGATIRAAEDLLALSPDDEEGLAVRDLARWRSGEEAEAQVEATTPSVARAAAQLYLEVGDPMTAWTSVRKIASEHLDQAILNRIGNALRRAGYISAARDVFEVARANDPTNARARHHCQVLAGEVHVLTGEWTPPRVRRPRRFRPVRGRILHVVGQSLPHAQVGYTIRTQHITRAQLEVGLEPHVVTRLGFPWDQGVTDTGELEEVDGIAYHRLRPSGETPIRLDEQLAQSIEHTAELVRELRPALLHAASDYRNAQVALELGRTFRLPVVYEVRGFWEETRLVAQGAGAIDRECYRWHREREATSARAVDHVVTLAEVMKAELIERGVAPERISVVPNAVDVNRFAPIERDAALAATLGLPPGAAVLGYVSTLSPYEGIDVLVDAVAELRRRGRRVYGLLVGDGESRAALETRVEALGLSDAVLFTGRVPHADVARYYGLIDIFVVPRTPDRVSNLVTPLKPVEAMATGRAVVVSDVRGLAELVEDGVTGLVFRPGDPDHLADVVEPLLEDRARIEQLGIAARAWVCDGRTWHRNGERYLELYHSLGAA
jgi:PEP-CTERM/exosortase A-associated glycosyltransferase